jgi:hypothetical protein
MLSRMRAHRSVGMIESGGGGGGLVSLQPLSPSQHLIQWMNNE